MRIYSNTGSGSTGIRGATGPRGIPGSVYRLAFTQSQAVPDPTGTLYLRVGQGVLSSTVGFDAMKSGTLIGISVRVNAIDAARDYQIDIVKDSSGTPVIINSLALPASTLNTRVTGLADAIAATDEIGARIVLTSGSGASTFTSITVLAEFTNA